MSIPKDQQRALLERIARAAMAAKGFVADFSPQATAEANAVTPPHGPYAAGTKDLRSLPWCSIDNDDSRDLDQLTVAITAAGVTRALVAVADVSAAVPAGSALDRK